MNKLSFYAILFSIFLSLVSSESKTPLRGISKDPEKEFLINDDSKIVTGILEKENETNVDRRAISEISHNNTLAIVPETRLLSLNQKIEITSDSAGPNDFLEPEEPEDSKESQESKCGNSFVMWFNQGIAITTVECSKYTVIYSAKKNGVSEPKYIEGQVTTVLIESENVIKVNDIPLSEISKTPESPTSPSTHSSISEARILQVKSTQEVETAKVYSFPVKDRNFEVYLLNSEEVSERDKYNLVYEGEVFYSGKENNSKYTLMENGDLVNSKKEIVLKGDSSSFAHKTTYIIPSLFAVLLSTFLF